MKDKKLSVRYYDFLFVGYFSLTPIAQFFLPNNLLLDNWFPIFFVSFFFASLPYLDRPKAYTLRVFIAFVSASIIGIASIVLVGGLTGYEIIFVLGYVKLFVIPSSIAFVVARVYRTVINTRMVKEARVKMELAGLVLVSVFGVIFLAMQSSQKADLTTEINKRLQLAKRISTYYVNNPIDDLDTEKAMRLGLFESLYIANNNKLTHGYGGSIEISSSPEGISLEYKGIPGGDPCYWFYFMNSPSTYGFSDTYVDGVSTKTKTNSIDMKKKEREHCRSGQKSVSVRYFAPYETLDRSASFLKNLE